MAIDEHEPIFLSSAGSYPAEEETQTFWKENAQNKLIEELLVTPIDKQAKNVIIFLGDGMGVSTLTAARYFVVTTFSNPNYISNQMYTSDPNSFSDAIFFPDPILLSDPIFS